MVSSNLHNLLVQKSESKGHGSGIGIEKFLGGASRRRFDKHHSELKADYALTLFNRERIDGGLKPLTSFVRLLITTHDTGLTVTMSRTQIRFLIDEDTSHVSSGLQHRQPEVEVRYWWRNPSIGAKDEEILEFTCLIEHESTIQSIYKHTCGYIPGILLLRPSTSYRRLSIHLS